MNRLQKVLLVDDDKTNIRVLSIMLEDKYELKSVYSGDEALEIIEEFLPDIVLLDIMMPGISGYEACKAIRANRHLPQPKIILLTAKSGLEDRLEGYNVGADDYIIKPFDQEELLAKVNVFKRLNEDENKVKQLNRQLFLRQQDIPNILWECDSNLHYTYLDDNVERILGFSTEEMLGKPITDFLDKEDYSKFNIRLKKHISKENPSVKGLTINLLNKEGQSKALQVFADAFFDKKDQLAGMTGMYRDMRAFSILDESNEKVALKTRICVDSNCRLIYADEDIQKGFNIPEDEQEIPDFLQYLVDPSLGDFFPFAFDQKEDIPFPVEIFLAADDDETKGHYSVQLSYCHEGGYLEGSLVPVGATAHLNQVSQNIEKQDKIIKEQEEALKGAVVIDADMQESILKDAQNLSAEILGLAKSLETYAFNDSSSFSFVEFDDFLKNRNLQIYCENLRLMGNKIHGLKGSCGFLMSSAKELCHEIEEITRPLAELKLVLTQTLSRLIKQFVFKIEEMLEQFQENQKTEFSIDNWLEKISQALEQGKNFIGNNVDKLTKLMSERSVDNGEVRKRKKEDYLSVSVQGYEVLAEKVKEMFYSLTVSLNEEELFLAGGLYNQFLNTHQQIKKVPLNLTRYERLIPKLAKEYEKEADFVFKDHQVKADIEFWNVIHEILNHVLKNAVIHGLEKPEERSALGKESTGKVVVELNEDALHILMTISDDGKGINVKKIAEKAIEDNILTSEQLSDMSKEEIINLLFLQGMSTVESMDDNAGRGVGMNAVQEAMHQLQGKCQIDTEIDKGCSWNFSFSKNNVSLPCFIISIGDLHLAIPEEYIESFVNFSKQDVVTIKKNPSYRVSGKLVPLIDSKSCFAKEASGDHDFQKSVVILRNKEERKGMVINDILNHAILPMQPLPKIYRETQIYQGITIYNNEPIQVVNIDSMT